MIAVQKVTTQEDCQKAFAIRNAVFVHGQHVPARMEHEGDDISRHFLATVDNVPAGAARWRKTESGYKLERFAVLPEFRGKGIATEMIKAVLADLPADAGYVYLNAQLDAVPLYLKNGFVTVGDQFEEAGIRHYKMVKQ